MRVYEYATMSAEERRAIFGRARADLFKSETVHAIRAIYEEVRRDGDQALVGFLQRFHDVSITPGDLRVTPEEIAAARASVAPAVQQAIATGIANIRRYNERLMQGDTWLE